MVAALRFRTVPTTSVITTQPKGTKPAISSKSGIAQASTQTTADTVKDPDRLSKALSFIQTQIDASTLALRSDPEVSSLIFVGLSVTAGIPFTLTHNFGRPFQGYRITRANVFTLIHEVALPAGLTPSQAVALVSNGTGLVDIRVW